MASYQSDDVCIVGYGCVLPGAENPEAFWSLLSQQKCQIREASGGRFEDLRVIYNSDRKAEDSSYSKLAACIDDETYQRCAARNQMNPRTSSQLEIMAVEATRQALAGLEIKASPERVSIVLGFMNPEDRFFRQNFLREYPKMVAAVKAANHTEEARSLEILETNMKAFFRTEPSVENVMPTSVLAKLNERFSFSGESVFVDAACASSLAAMDLAVKKLKTGAADYMITGGLENNLTAGAFVIFSAVGALAEEACLPFDERAAGIVQGEGAVVFVLRRLSDALRDGDKIHAVLRGCGGSSDGRRGSLFEPTPGGQSLTYKRAFQNLNSNRVDYIEGHGTATTVGDVTELRSLADYFSGLQTPIGSVKALIGHTKGTAGAASVLKCILSMQQKSIPGSGYFSKFPKGIATDLFVNREAIRLKDRPEPYRMAVSSFGFGGTNYHLVIDEFKPGIALEEAKARTANPALLCAYRFVPAGDFERLSSDSSVRVPPKSRSQIDRFQLLALYAAELTLKSSGIQPRFINRDEVSVISASSTGLDSLIYACQRLAYTELRSRVSDIPVEIFEKIIALKEQFPRITEDSGPGILNNVVAGRICNWFDFKGFNYNIDADLASPAAAFDKACLEASLQDQVVVLVAFDESYNAPELSIQRNGVHCFVVASSKAVEREALPVLCAVDEVIHVWQKASLSAEEKRSPEKLAQEVTC